MRNLCAGAAAQANGVTATAMAIAENYYGRSVRGSKRNSRSDSNVGGVIWRAYIKLMQPARRQ